jgi:aminopeptidase-like protein
MSYSIPERKRLLLGELKEHIHALPQQPDLIPYRTSHYADDWAFCMAHRQLEELSEDAYEVVIDSTLENGSLTYGEYLPKAKPMRNSCFRRMFAIRPSPTTTARELRSSHISRGGWLDCGPGSATDFCSLLGR